MPLPLTLDTGATTTAINQVLLATSDTIRRPSPRSSSRYDAQKRRARPVDSDRAQRSPPPNTQSTARPRHTLPPSASVDVLIGLDFFRNHRLTLDFRSGQMDLA